MADFIEKSEWVSTKEDVQELASCIINAVKVNLSISRSIVELIRVLSSQKGHLSDLVPFTINYLLNNFISNNNLCAFLYHLSRINLVSVDYVISEIKKKNMPKNPVIYKDDIQNVYWFLPEIYDQKIMSKDKLIKYLDCILNKDQIKKENIQKKKNFDENLIKETIDKIRILRDKCGKLIESIKKRRY